MSIKIVIYSIKEVFGSKVLSLDLTGKIVEVIYNSHVIIDVPVTGLKRFVWYPYLVNSYIFDNGSVFFMLADYKKIDRKYALQYLINYERNGRVNAKDYTLKTPKRIPYEKSNKF